MKQRGGPRRQATSARNRRDLLAGDVETTAGEPFRRRLWVLLRWVMAEASAAPAAEQEQLLTDLHDMVDRMNAKRRDGGRVR